MTARPPFPPAGRLLATQARFQVVEFVRIPAATFFTIVLPLVMLVLFVALFGNTDVDTGTGTWPLSQFYVASIAGFTAVSGTFTNLANMVPYRRQDGIMKRWRGTPLPRWIYLGGFVGSAAVVALAGVAIMVGLGIVAYGVRLEVAKLPALAVTLLIGVAAFSALGIAVAGLVRNPEAAPAVANAVVLPLAFVSDVFIPLEDAPRWLTVLGDVFPLKPFVQSLQAVFNPAVEAPAFQTADLAVVAAWGLAGAVVAWKTFKWEPVADVGPNRRRSRRRAQPGA